MGRESRAALVIMGVAVLVGTQAGAKSENGENRIARGSHEATLRGAYGIQIQGTRLAPAPTPVGTIESVIGVIVRHYDGRGNFTQVNNEKDLSVGSAQRTGRDSARIR